MTGLEHFFELSPDNGLKEFWDEIIINDVFYVTSPDFQTNYYVSPSYEAIWGRKVSDLQNNPKAWIESIVPEDRQKVVDEITKLQDEKKPSVASGITYRIKHPDGAIRWIESKTIQVRDREGRIERLVGVSRDITQLKLEHDRMKELDALKNKFIQIASHHFRTPLNAVRWNLEALMGDGIGKLTETQRQFVRLTHDATLLSIERLHDLLTAVDIEEGRMRIERETVDIYSLAGGVLQSLKKACGAKDLQCRYEAPAGEPLEVQADPEKLRSALEKMVANAVLYSEKGGEVAVLIKKTDGHVRIAVTDHGVGIPKAEQKKIFTRFFRASNAAAMLPDAPGLGLYIAKYFVEVQGGKIGFESDEGKGSTFWMELPL